MSAAPEAYLSPGTICALSHGVPVQGKAVLLDVDIVARVAGIPGVIEGSQLGLVSGDRAEKAGLESLLGQLPDAVHPPHIVVLVIEKSVPILTHERTVAQIWQLKIGKHGLKRVDMITYVVVVLLDMQGGLPLTHGPEA